MLALVENPNDYADHIQLFSSNVILQVVYSRRAETVKDRCIQVRFVVPVTISSDWNSC